MKPAVAALALTALALVPVLATSTARQTREAQPRAQCAAVSTPTRPRIEVVFALDTTGSMSDLIEGAKAKVWSIARALAEGKPRPEIAIGLVAYRDRGDEYVTRTTPLSTDLDLVYKDLMALRADGGGDTPESVNRALAVAVNDIAWSQAPGVTRMVFLVGDAPAHMDYPQDVAWMTSVEQAVRKGIVVNGVRCGGDPGTAEQFTAIAHRGEGKFVSLEQDGGMEIVSTPHDAPLAELQRQLAATYVTWGDRKERVARLDRARAAEAVAAAAPPAAAADRAAFLADSGAAIGDKDLVSEAARGAIDVRTIQDEQLPESLRETKPEERAGKLAEIEGQRLKLQTEIARVAAARDAFLARPAGGSGKKPAFQEKVLDMVREQAAKNGVRY